MQMHYILPSKLHIKFVKKIMVDTSLNILSNILLTVDFVLVPRQSYGIFGRALTLKYT